MFLQFNKEKHVTYIIQCVLNYQSLWPNTDSYFQSYIYIVMYKVL